MTHRETNLNKKTGRELAPYTQHLEEHLRELNPRKANSPASWFHRLLTTTWVKEQRKIYRRTKSGESPRKNVFKSVNRLMSMGMKKDAIRLLYEFKLYREAADILRAAGASNNAAWLYVKARRWEQAEHCFLQNQDRLNAAKCAQSAGKFEKAVPIFKEFKEWSAAARCYRRMGHWRQAAFYFGLAGFRIESVQAWHEWYNSEYSKLDSKPSNATALSTDELHLIINLMSDGICDPVLMNILDASKWTGLFVIELIKRGKIAVAAEIYEPRQATLSRIICAGAKTNPDIADSFLTLCQMVNDRIGMAEILDQPKNAIPSEFSGTLSDNTTTDLSPEFSSSKFFDQLDKEERSRLWQLGRIVPFRSGDVIVEVGASPACTFTLLSGQVEIIRLENHFERVVDRLTTGQNFGESWLLVSQKSSVRIIAAIDCHVHIIEKTGFDQLVSSGSIQAARIASQLAQKICAHLLDSFGVRNQKSRPA